MSEYYLISQLPSLDGINEVLYRQMGDEEYPFISISDSNTCGLLGEPFESKNGEPNNLYNLVLIYHNLFHIY